MKPAFSLSTPPIKTWYQALPKNSKIKWPVVEVGFRRGQDFLPQKILALIDSGASSSIMHKELAEVLGVDFKRMNKPKAGGSSVSGYYKYWTLKDFFPVEIYGYQFNFQFQVIDNANLFWPCILGEDSIFQVAKLCFLKFKGYFEIQFRLDVN